MQYTTHLQIFQVKIYSMKNKNYIQPMIMDMQICWCIYKKWKWSKYIKSWFAGKCKLFFPFDFWYFYDASRMLLKQSSINVNTLNRLYGFLLSSMCLLDYVLGLERWRIKWQDQQGTQRQPANCFWKAAHWTRHNGSYIVMKTLFL